MVVLVMVVVVIVLVVVGESGWVGGSLRTAGGRDGAGDGAFCMGVLMDWGPQGPHTIEIPIPCSTPGVLRVLLRA